MKIVQYIPTDRFISRKELADLTGFSDRHVRELIEQARRAGHRIVSNTHAGGYKIASDGREWLDFTTLKQQNKGE